MLKKWLFSFIGCMIALSVIPSEISAEAGAVQVHIVDVPVKVNGQLIDNRQSEYPFLIYKDITYLPLSWDMIQELELDAEWSDGGGLILYKHCCVSDYWDYPAQDKKPFIQHSVTNNLTNRSYAATVAAYPIELWGVKIRNEEEPYPFLEFRNVTYMPLTWNVAHRRLMMDLQLSDKDGLSVWSGQDQVLRQIVYDDRDALYADAMRIKDHAYSMVRISKSLQNSPVWLDEEQANAIRSKADQGLQAMNSVEGTAAEIERKGDILTFQGIQLAELRDEDKKEVGGTTLAIQGTLYDIDEKRKLLAVNTYFPIAVIGPPPGSRYQLFSIVDGKAKAITEYPFLPQHVWKNADGTVWISRNRMKLRSIYVQGSGLLALMDKDGHIRVANDVWNAQDVIPIGFSSPTRNSADQQGLVIVRLNGIPKHDELVYPESDGIYEVDASFGLRRLSNAPDLQDELIFYKDSYGDIYTINKYSNTVTNWTQNRYKTWTDLELFLGS